MSNRTTYSEKMNTISRFRRTGDVVKTSRQTGYSSSYVSQVFSGLYQNENIVNYAFKVANARRTASARRSA
jgi:hypothetical protein